MVRAAIDEGVALVGEGLARTPLRPDRDVVQAAIAACHCLALTWEETHWAAVVSWYDVLAALDPPPVVRLYRAVAVAERAGAAGGLAALEGLRLPGYALLPAARGELLVRLDRMDEAAAPGRCRCPSTTRSGTCWNSGSRACDNALVTAWRCDSKGRDARAEHVWPGPRRRMTGAVARRKPKDQRRGTSSCTP